MAKESCVLVPDDGAVTVAGTLRAGEATLLGEVAEGTDLDLAAAQDAPEGSGRIELSIAAGLAEVVVASAPPSRTADGPR